MNIESEETIHPDSNVEPALQTALARAREQMQVVGEIGQAREILSGEVEKLARIITERAAATVGCERVNVWLFDEAETRLKCIDAYAATDKSHTSGAELTEAQYGNEFRALEQSQYVAADEPLSDPRTTGYVDGYLKPPGITSMLDTVIQISGKRLGLLCFEHVHHAHHWARDEIAFAEQLADKLGLALVSRERHAVEAALRASEEKFRSLVESSSDFIWESDESLRYTYASPQIAHLLGYQPAELLGRMPFDFMPAVEAQRSRDFLWPGGEPRGAFAGLASKVVHKDGHEVMVETSAVPRFDDYGRFCGYRGIDRDVTERRRSAERLQFANTLLESEIESAPDGVLAIDTSTGLASWNTKFQTMWNLSAAVVASRDPDAVLEEVLPQLERPDQFWADVVHFRSDPSSSIHSELGLTDGRTVECHAAFLRAPTGRSLGRINFFRDVTAHKRVEEEARQARQLLEGILDSIPARVFWKNRDLVFRGGNMPFAQDAGFSVPAQLIGKSDLDMAWRDQAELYRKDDRQIIETGAPKLLIEEPQTLPDGSTRTLLTSKIPLRDALGNIDGVLGMYLDISERKHAEEALRQSEECFRAVSETAQDAIIMIDSLGKIVYWNRAAERSLGYTPEQALGMDVHEIMASATEREKAAIGLGVFAKTGRGPILSGVREVSARRRDGTEIPVELSVSAIRLHSAWHAVAFMRDITERKQSESHLQHLARHDALTGLPNRRGFIDALGDAIMRARRDHTTFAVLYLDLDHFKDINDTLGHPVGDLVLKEVAARLRVVARETDIVARFGGDEFAVLQAGLCDPADAAAFAERILTNITTPFVLAGNEIRTGTSVGISVCDETNGDAEKLLSQADVALYRAKSEGRGTFRYFTEAMDVEVHTRVRLATELRQALAGNQLFLVYQPQVEVETGRIVGVEALLRWRHPEHGMINPVDFIPVAEKTGLIVAIGHWVMQEACRQARRWLDDGIAPTLMAVNLSGLQFKNPYELESGITAILAETGLSPQSLELELTESILMDASQEHNDLLLRLRSSGLRLAIDDFGTGYSSLDYLRRFPVDRIKIAQNFIAELTSSNGDAAIVKAALSLARELHLPAIVEGVETAEQLALLRAWGCREVQGYYYAKPLLPDEVAPLLRAGFIVPGNAVAAAGLRFMEPSSAPTPRGREYPG